MVSFLNAEFGTGPGLHHFFRKFLPLCLYHLNNEITRFRERTFIRICYNSKIALDWESLWCCLVKPWGCTLTFWVFNQLKSPWAPWWAGFDPGDGTNNSSSAPPALSWELPQVRSISKVVAEYWKFTDSSLFKTVTPPLLQFLSTVIKARFNFTQDIKHALKTWFREAVGTITFNFLA